MTTPQKSTITSLELVDQINIFRKEDGKSELLHKNLLSVIRDEFEEEINELIIQPVNYVDKKGESRLMFELTIPQAKQVLVRESKTVRKAVIAYLERLESKVNMPQTYLEALRALVSAEEEKLQLSAKLQEAKPKVDTYDRIIDRNALTNLRDTAKEIKVGEKAMISLLILQGFLYRDMAGKIKPVAKYVNDGLFELKSWIREVKNQDGTVSDKAGNQTMVTIKGKTKIMELVEKFR